MLAPPRPHDFRKPGPGPDLGTVGPIHDLRDRVIGDQQLVATVAGVAIPEDDSL
jgi:hypothetical protein